MKNSLLHGLAIATSFCVAIVSCTPTAPTASTSPSVTASASPTTSPKPTTASATPSASATANPTTSPSASPSASATPSESPKPTSSPAADAKPDKAPDTVRIAVVNNSGKVLKAIYMSAPSKQDWGDNELDAPLADREKADFEWKRSDYKGDDAGCVFDIGAEYNDGTKTILDPIDVCKTPAINLK